VLDAPRAVLRGAGYGVVDVPDSTVCCGAAGLYNILQPEAAAELGRRKAEAVLSTGAPIVAVANPGCAMQIRRHLEDAGRGDIRVAHPVELVD
jgi:glycolate oxidase iron-sulfur subunit